MRFTLMSLLLAVALHAADRSLSHLDLRTAGEAAYARKDYDAAREAYLAALKLRPDSPRYLHQLAAISALAGDTEAASDYLERLAALGVHQPIAKNPDFASVQGTPGFLGLVRRLEGHLAPQGEAAVFAELPGRTGLCDGIAYRPRTGDLFLSDVHHRCVWKRDRAGQVSRFTAPDDELLGLFGLALDERRNTLWAAMAAVPEMSGYTKEAKGVAALAEFNLSTSELRRVILVPGDGRDHALGDLTVGSEGTVFATDNGSPIVWRLAPGADEMEKLVEHPAWVALQGIVLADRTLLVADYANGLYAVDLANGNTVRAFAPPANSTLIGLDGLVALPDGVAAVQNGVEPQRILRLTFSPDRQTIARVAVLAAGLPYLTDLGLVAIIDDQLAVLAGAGWAGFDPEKAPQPRPHTVRIFRTPAP